MPLRTERLRGSILLAALLALSACATPKGPAASDPDPWRRGNERIFRFNEGFDKGFLEPVAEGYDAVVPGLFETMIGNFFENLTVPRTFLNDLLQGKPLRATQDLGRVLINTVAGMGGLVDAASEMGVPKNEEDFGQTLARWGTGPGPYVVIPLAGPNTVRDTLAAPVDIATNPTTWVNVVGLSAVRVVNTRAKYLEEIDQSRKDAVNYYLFVRDAFLSNREKEIRDGAPAPMDEDLYDTGDLDDDGGENPDAQ